MTGEPKIGIKDVESAKNVVKGLKITLLAD